MRIWLFRTFLIFVVVAVGGMGWFALQTRSLSPGLDPTLAALATGLSANTATGPPTFTAAPPTQSPTPAPTLSSEFGTLILALRVSGRTHLHAYLPGASDPIPLTSGDWDDRDPSISPDGTKIAFASNREGGWDLYVLDLDDGETRRLTDTPGYEGNPTWSPDAFYLAYENYQGSDFDIWILSVDGSQAPIQLTNQPSLEISPSWDPGGRRIAFISDRDGNPDVFVADLDKPDDRFRNLTRSPNEVESDPSFSADGAKLAFVSNAHGLESILMLPLSESGAGPHSVGQGRRPTWSPDGGRMLAVLSTPYDGSSLVVYGTRPSIAAAVPLLTVGSVESAVWIEGGISGGWVSSTVGAGQASLAPGILASRNADGRLRLVTLPGLKAPQPMLSDAVDEAFIALRDRAAAVLGWDFLSQLDYAFVGLNDPLPPGFQFNDWLYTGRGFAFSQGAVEAGWVEIVREDFAGQTYWRVFVRALRQDGSQGEPLRERPWDFRSRRLSDPLAYDQGGRPDVDIPEGYYVDFTRLAGDFGFERLSALANWRTYLPGTRFNEFAMTGGLSWEQAMLELYPAGAIATPTEFRTPTATPTRTPWPTVTPWWWWWRTPTPSATQGPSATPSATP